MKKVIFLLTSVIVLASCSTSQRTSQTTSNNSNDRTKTTTNGIDGKLGSATSQVITTTDKNGNSIIMTPMYTNNRVQGWDVVIISPQGKVLYQKGRDRKKYKDALYDAYNDYYGYGYGSNNHGGFLRNLLNAAVSGTGSYPGTYGGYNQPRNW